jgi:WhiB family redox-sensing transcriptional regulator
MKNIDFLADQLHYEPLQGELDWRQRAACDPSSGDRFYPEWGSLDDVDAKKICQNDCDVRAECLEYALDNNERHGVWGGLSQQQRNNLKKKHGRYGVIGALGLNRSF